MARLVAPLDTLRAEFNAVNPSRDRASDGWIGNADHARTISDHNPDATGAVHAIDVDVDGVPMGRIVAYLVGECQAGRENRLQYIIYRRTIWSRSWGWKARRYKGRNPHTRHAHFSARPGMGGGGSWGVAAHFATVPGPRPRRPAAAGGHAPGSRRLVLREPALAGADVRYVQRWIGSAHCGPPDGRYGPKTREGVRWYQRMRGLAVDGIVGPATWRHLGVRYTGPS